MKIILEGCDGTGKTTLAKLLAEKYNLDICHCTADDPGDFDFYKNTARKENVVWDRHTIGELIYSRLFNRKCRIGTEDARIAIAYARENGGKAFVLTADDEEIIKRLESRKTEDPKIIDNIKWINNEFKFYAKRFNIPIIDTSKMTLLEIFNEVEKDDGFRFIHK